MTVKVAALDFDGTLRRDGAFAQEDIEAIDAWREAGHLAISATGRSRSSLKRGMAGMNRAFDYNVLSNGGSCTDPRDELIFGHILADETVEKLVTAFQESEGLAVYGTTLGDNDGVFANNTHTAGSELTAGFLQMTLESISEHDFAVVPLWIPGNQQLRGEVVSWIEKHLPEVSVTTNHNFIDIMAEGVNKGSGIKQLLAHLDIDDFELYTFGDSWNDIPMHTIADHSHSFIFSPDDVKQATDHVIDRVADCLMGYA